MCRGNWVLCGARGCRNIRRFKSGAVGGPQSHLPRSSGLDSAHVPSSARVARGSVARPLDSADVRGVRILDSQSGMKCEYARGRCDEWRALAQAEERPIPLCARVAPRLRSARLSLHLNLICFDRPSRGAKRCSEASGRGGYPVGRRLGARSHDSSHAARPSRVSGKPGTRVAPVPRPSPLRRSRLAQHPLIQVGRGRGCAAAGCSSTRNGPPARRHPTHAIHVRGRTVAGATSVAAGVACHPRKWCPELRGSTHAGARRCFRKLSST